MTVFCIATLVIEWTTVILLKNHLVTHRILGDLHPFSMSRYFLPGELPLNSPLHQNFQYVIVGRALIGQIVSAPNTPTKV